VGHHLEDWPDEPSFIPRGLLEGKPGAVRVVTFLPDVVEELRRDLLAFSPRYVTARRRSLDNPQHLLAFVNKWGVVSAQEFTSGPTLLCERVSAVRDGLRPFVDAAAGQGLAVLRALERIAPAGSYVTACAIVRRVGGVGFHVELQSVTLRDVLTLLVAEWAGRPPLPCENPRCRHIVLGQRFCSEKCANVVYVRRSRRLANARAALAKGSSERLVAQRYGLTVAEVQGQRARLNERTNVRARKRKGARR
jgi:hypothetical protein